MGARLIPVSMLAAVALLAGCELRADVEVRVERDGSGVFAVTLDADHELRAEASAAGFDLAESVVGAADGLDGWEATSADGRVRLETAFDDPDGLRLSSAAFADALAAPELRPLEAFDVVVTESRVLVRGAAGLEPAEAAGALVPGDDPQAVLEETVTYTVSVGLPGEVVEHNADRLDDGWLTWEVPAGTRVEVAAAAELPPVRRWWPWALGGAALALSAALLAARRRRRRRRPWMLAR